MNGLNLSAHNAAKPDRAELDEGGEVTENVDRKSTENVDGHLVRVEDGEMLQKLADELVELKPWSYSILGPIRCHQTGELPYTFYVDQWPSFNICVGILRPEYFYKFKKPPYVMMHFFALTNDPVLIHQMFNRLNFDWRVPIMLQPGPNKQQMDAIKPLFEQYGIVRYAELWCTQHYATDKKQIKMLPLPEGYEYIQLKSDRAFEVANNWNIFNCPYKLQDIETLMERFQFLGIIHTQSGKLVAQVGQTHVGCAGVGWVDPEHRGKKLFQALVSRQALDIIERHGFTFGYVNEKNVASRVANNNIGMNSEASHRAYCGYMEPFNKSERNHSSDVDGKSSAWTF